VNRATKIAGKTVALILLLFACSTMYTMERERTVRDVWHMYLRSLDGFLDLLDGKEPAVEPYVGFHDILHTQGDGIGSIQIAAVHKLGCMCKCNLGVPEQECGLAAAQRYFSFAAQHGHIESFEELARCACELGDYRRAFDAWRQQRFLEVAACCRMESKRESLEEISSVLNFIPLMSKRARHSTYCKDALEAIQERLHSNGSLQACCLLARLYAVTHDKRVINYVQEVLAPRLSEVDLEEACQLIEKTHAHQALQAATESGDMQATMLLGFVLFYERNYKQSYFLLKKASQEGINKACVYRMLMDINGLGTKQSFSFAYTQLQEWSKSRKGRAWIALLASMVDHDTLDMLSKAQNNDQARFILGTILYAQGNGQEAYNYLHPFAQGHQNFYASYCCAKILSKNTTNSSREIGMLYARVLASPEVDQDLYKECRHALREIALEGNATGIIEMCRLGLDESVPFSDIVALLDGLKRKTKKDQLDSIGYAHSSGCILALREAREQGNKRASLMLAMLFGIETCIAQPKLKKSALMKEALGCIQESRGHVIPEKDLASLAFHLGCICKQEDLQELAFAYMEYAAQIGSEDANRELGYLMFLKKDLAPEEMKKALARIEESALRGNVDDLRLLAQLYRYNAQLESASQCCIHADIAKSYKFASMVLERIPDDKAASRIVGCFLAMHGGYADIPAGQEDRAYTLLSHGLAEPVSDTLATDYYVMGCLCLRRGYIEQAKLWFDKDPGFALCACGKAVIDFIELPSDRRSQAFDAIEKAVSNARKYEAKDRDRFFELVLNKKFIELLNNEVLVGNIRAQVLMARIAMLTHDKDLGVSKEQALDYIVMASERGCSSALSFLGFLYNHGTEVPKLESRALIFLLGALKSKQVPQHIIKEIMEELVIIASQSEISREKIIAAYYAAALLMCSDVPENIRQALCLIHNAESDRTDRFSQDVSLASCIYDSGAWACLERLADRGNGDAAAALGLAYGIRYMGNLIDFEHFKSEGCKRLEQALCNGSKVLTAEELSKKYLVCVRKRVLEHSGSYDDIRPLLERAHQLDAHNDEVTYILASLYRQKLFSDIPLSKSIRMGIDLLEGLADKGHELAALEVGLGYLALKFMEDSVKSYTKALHYLFIAASKGNKRALLVLVCSIGKEKNKYTKLVARQIFKYIDDQIARSEISQEIRNYFLGLKAVLNKQWDIATSYFDQLAQSSCPDIMVEIAMLYFHIKNDIPKAISLTVKAIDMAGKQKLDLFQINIGQLLQSFLADLELRSCSDDMIKKLVSCIRMKLKQYDYSL